MFSEIVNMLRAMFKKRKDYMFCVYICENKLTVNAFKIGGGKAVLDYSPIDMGKKSAERKIREVSEFIGTLPTEKKADVRR